MNISKLSPILLILLLAAGVKLPIITPASQAEADKTIDHEQARKLSDLIPANLLKNDRPMLRDAMEKGFRDYYDDAAFASLIDKMFATFGEPLDVEYKMDELGRKTGADGHDKPMRKFWYATRTTKYEKGTVFLTVEVVPDEGHLASSGVALVTFPVGVPPALK
ncbi:MAG TPA: hypothetical protein VF397_06055 [Pyrinomonadaceae bacterium]